MPMIDLTNISLAQQELMTRISEFPATITEATVYLQQVIELAQFDIAEAKQNGYEESDSEWYSVLPTLKATVDTLDKMTGVEMRKMRSCVKLIDQLGMFSDDLEQTDESDYGFYTEPEASPLADDLRADDFRALGVDCQCEMCKAKRKGNNHG